MKKLKLFYVALSIFALLLAGFGKPTKAEDSQDRSYNYDQYRNYGSNQYFYSRQIIKIRNHAYYPRFLEVRNNRTITWINNDRVPHTVTSIDGRFDSGILYPGQRFTLRLDRPGTYRYYCRIHPFMRGNIRVMRYYVPFYGSGYQRY